MRLSDDEQAVAAGAAGPARATAMRVVAEAARLLGAERLVPIASAHVDGCLYHGDRAVAFIEGLVRDGGRIAVPTTLNVGALDLLHPERVKGDAHFKEMAARLMQAHVALRCQPSWTCAPYQAGHRPKRGEHVAWGESNAVAFVNSVLGARTNRCGDFLDICAALAGRAPYCGLHLDANRKARVLVDTSPLSTRLKEIDAFYPVLGAWLGAELGGTVAAIEGLPRDVSEDRLKALGAGAASTGSVGLFHVVGVTPEAPDVAAACGGNAPERVVKLSPEMLRAARESLSTVRGERIDVIAIGSPHFSSAEFAALIPLVTGKRLKVPFYVCTSRAALEPLRADGRLSQLEQAGVTVIVDTCVIVAPILPPGGGVLMTNSAKFAHYGPALTGYEVVYGSLEDCVASAASGALARDESLWR
jgi:predicted aconitase